MTFLFQFRDNDVIHFYTIAKKPLNIIYLFSILGMIILLEFSRTQAIDLPISRVLFAY